MTASATPASDIELSIVVPALNEEDNIDALVAEVKAAILDKGISAELIVVDDGSTDTTPQKLAAAAGKYEWVRPLRRDKAQGQSSAMYAGIQAARGTFIATLDADLQNDPADLPAMLEKVRGNEYDMAQGDRSANRRDHFVRRISSWVGRTARNLILSDKIRDTGCTTRVLRSTFAKQMPLMFKGMHRFMPIYARMLGARIIELPVHHRPRVAGVAKYGVLNRGFVGLVDCFAMRWMLKRHRSTAASVIPPTRS